jgi:hypothetical protein
MRPSLPVARSDLIRSLYTKGLVEGFRHHDHWDVRPLEDIGGGAPLRRHCPSPFRRLRSLQTTPDTSVRQVRSSLGRVRSHILADDHAVGSAGQGTMAIARWTFGPCESPCR